MALRNLGQVLVDLGFITDDQLEEIKAEHERNPEESLGRIAEQMGYINDEQLAQAQSEQFGLQMVYLGEMPIPANVLASIPEAMAQLYRVVPISLENNVLTIATCDPQKLSVEDELRTFLGFEVRSAVATERDIQKALDKFYSGGTRERREHRPGHGRGQGPARRPPRRWPATGRSI